MNCTAEDWGPSNNSIKSVPAHLWWAETDDSTTPASQPPVTLSPSPDSWYLLRGRTYGLVRVVARVGFRGDLRSRQPAIRLLHHQIIQKLLFPFLWGGLSRRQVLRVLPAILLVGCFSGQPRTGPPADPYRISTEELQASRVENLYDAVRQLRPGWFRRIGTGDQRIMVYFDDQQVGGVTSLGRFTTLSVAEVRYLTPTEAQVRYGQTNYGRPAILLQSPR